MIQAHSGPTAPVALEGLAAATLDCSEYARVVIQADLLSSSTGRLYFRVDHGDEEAACSPANAEGFITAGGTAEINLDYWIKSEAREPHVYLALTDASGVTALGGASDRVLVYAEKAYPELTR